MHRVATEQAGPLVHVALATGSQHDAAQSQARPAAGAVAGLAEAVRRDRPFEHRAEEVGKLPVLVLHQARGAVVVLLG